MTTRYDYPSLEAEYIRGTMSINELCRIHEIPDVRSSSIHRMARKKDSRGRTWADKRAEYQSRSSDRTIQRLASRSSERLVREVEVRDHALEVLDRMLTRAEETLEAKVSVIRNGESVEEPRFWIHPKDVGTLVDKLMLVLGRPVLGAGIEESDGLASGSVLITAGADTQFGIEAIARLGDLARERSRGALARSVATSPLPDGPEPRTN